MCLGGEVGGGGGGGGVGYPGSAPYLIVTAASHWWRLSAPHVPTPSERTHAHASKKRYTTPMLCINAPYA